MADHLDFIIRSSAKVVQHCETLLRSKTAPDERFRLIQRIEAEKRFVAELMSATGRRQAA